MTRDENAALSEAQPTGEPVGGVSQQASAAALPAAEAPGDCTCGGKGVCVSCVLADLERQNELAVRGMVTVLDATERALLAPPKNVVPIRPETDR